MEAGEPRLLCVDDEPNVLAGLERVLGFDYEVTTAVSGARGLAAIRAAKEPFAVVLSDMRMPEMDGATFLKRVREVSPDSTRVLLTGHTDLDGAVAAVNEGGIFRFLTKPTPAAVLKETVREAAKHFDLLRNERELLEETLRGAVSVLADLLSVLNSVAFSRAERISAFMRRLGEEVHSEDLWELEIAGRLSQIGCVVIPSEIVEKMQAGLALDREEEEACAKHPQIAYDLLRKIPRLARVAAIIRGQLGHDVEARGDDGDYIRQGSELLRLAIDLDRVLQSDEDAVEGARALAAKGYNARLIAIVTRWAEERVKPTVSAVSAAELSPEMVFAQDVRSRGGRLLVGKGQRAVPAIISRLKMIAARGDLLEPIDVHLDSL